MEDAAGQVTPARGVSALRAILGDIHVEQTLFSLPFVLVSAFVAHADAGRAAGFRTKLAWVVVALVAARSCAMAVNRFADAVIDAGNPRTARRAVPAGRVTRGAMAAFAAAMLGVFLLAAWMLNTLCLVLAPVALLFLVGYSWTKRFTPLCHVWLGVAIGIAPLGAWAGIRGDLASATPWLLFGAVATWIAGFDILYSCPDAAIDARDGLRSIPQTLGVERAFRVSETLHVATPVALAAAGAMDRSLGTVWWAALAVGVVLLVVEHRLVRPGDYARMPTAFFRLNAVFSCTFLAAAVLDVFVGS